MTASVSLRRGNGLDRPLYFDRQLLIAEDLSLEQGFADRRLAMLAQNLLGWGVGAGFLLSTRPASPADGDVSLVVGPGYGVTPLGDQVYLPQEIVIEAIAAAITGSCCAPGDCNDLAYHEREGRPAEAVRAWIVARPAQVDGGPRPAMPVGCGHPGNSMSPSRRCGGAQIEIACELPSPHGEATPDLAQLHEAICGPWGSRFPAPVEEAANYVVLGAVEIVPEGVFATPLGRRLIPRLDLLGRLVCTLHHGGNRYVTHIQPDREDKDRAIDKLAGFDDAGSFFVETLDEAIEGVESGLVYQTLPPGWDGRRLRVHKRQRRKYLRTEGDGKPPNDLLSLPEMRDV